MLLTIEYQPRTAEAEIHADAAGLDRLIAILDALRQRKAPDHEHLMTLAWAGQELTEDKQGDETELLHHLRIIFHLDSPVTP